MKIKRLLSLLLVLSALLGLASCTDTEPAEISTEAVETSAPAVEIDLTKYKVIRPEECGTDFTKAVIAFRKQLNSVLEADIGIGTDWSKDGVTDEINNAYEILVGQTNRTQSTKALDNAEDKSSFVIAIIDNKVVITTGAPDRIAEALDYFMTLIVDKKLVLEENYLYVSEPVGMLNVVADGKSDFKVVYKDGLDATMSSDNTKDLCDLEVVAAKDIREKIKTLTKVSPGLATDWVKTGTDTSGMFEILVGPCDRPEYDEFLAKLGDDGYGFGVVGNKIIVTGHTLTTIQLAVDGFISYLSSAVSTDSIGNKSLSILSNLSIIKQQEGYFIDFPKPETLKAYTNYDCGNDHLQYYYTDATLDDYKNYVKLLETNGFKLYQSNDIVNNLSATYTSKDGMLYVYYTPYEKSIRIISALDGKYTLIPNTTKESVASYTKITDTKITMMSLNYSAGNFGNCFIITLEDGSFFVIDGGGYGADYGDAQKFYNQLKALNKRPDGKIVIAGYWLSHDHWDHSSNFINMIKTYGKGNITIETCYWNVAAKSSVTNSNNPNYYIESNVAAMQAVVGKFNVVKIHTGQKFWVRNLEFEVLFTQEDIYPGRCNYFNETSSVLRMTAAGNTVMWLGDAKNYASAALVNRYGSYIESDIVQVAHHGYDGITVKAYTAMKPKTLLWPSTKANLDTFLSKYSSDSYLWNSVNQTYIYFADSTTTVTLPYQNGDTVVIGN